MTFALSLKSNLPKEEWHSHGLRRLHAKHCTKSHVRWMVLCRMEVPVARNGNLKAQIIFLILQGHAFIPVLHTLLPEYAHIPALLEELRLAFHLSTLQ